MLPLAQRAVGTADAVGDSLGEKGEEVEADTLLTQIFTYHIRIGQRPVYGIDAGIDNIGEHSLFAIRLNENAAFVGSTIAFMPVIEYTVVPFGEAVEIDAVAFCTLINL